MKKITILTTLLTTRFLASLGMTKGNYSFLRFPFSFSAFCLLLFLPLFCIAQNPLPRHYEYDDAGNRIVRKVIEIPKAPPAPEFSVVIFQLSEGLLSEVEAWREPCIFIFQ